MKRKFLIRIASICFAAFMAFAPVSASAATLIRRGSRGTEVKMIQMTLKELGYFTYPRATGYYGSITEAAVKRFQRDNKISPDGIVGRITRGALYGNKDNLMKSGITLMSTSNSNADKQGALDWFSKVQYVFDRGMNAYVTDVDTGKSFWIKRTFGTNHADVEPLTKKDSRIIKDIWNGWSWERRAVVVQVGGYTLAGALSAMPHAGVDSAPAVNYVSRRSGGYGWGRNLDAVKNNGADGVIDLHFKNSRTHGSNRKQASMQNMVEKAARYIEKNY
ncbi:peptidoglycan-binding protein [Mobilitalea sibirica]|uniref:Peptidoglycan-binding protein n=1 Tax=Mobilitalea sibirica TaxID=1462919 RepID=A0A8J7H2P7_9FIRM|nr:peptidoglycan-binding domain-containing protein [Mobilitalea sibirica]MBH1941129.1 peptidoglycan-binding protein [Mobilitalea sibirica]